MDFLVPTLKIKKSADEPVEVFYMIRFQSGTAEFKYLDHDPEGGYSASMPESLVPYVWGTNDCEEVSRLMGCFLDATIEETVTSSGARAVSGSLAVLKWWLLVDGTDVMRLEKDKVAFWLKEDVYMEICSCRVQDRERISPISALVRTRLKYE